MIALGGEELFPMVRFSRIRRLVCPKERVSDVFKILQRVFRYKPNASGPIKMSECH